MPTVFIRSDFRERRKYRPFLAGNQTIAGTSSDKVRGIKFRHNYGKSPALFCGFEQAQGDVVITMDADLQDSPDEIPELYRMITQDGYDLVSGWKQKRYDPLSKTLPPNCLMPPPAKYRASKTCDFNLRTEGVSQRVVKI